MKNSKFTLLQKFVDTILLVNVWSAVLSQQESCRVVMYPAEKMDETLKYNNVNLIGQKIYRSK